MANRPIIQKNVRIPVHGEAVISRVARRMREDHGFVHRLGRFIEEEANPLRVAFLSQRIEKLEEQLTAVQRDEVFWKDWLGAFAEEIEPILGGDQTSGEGRAKRLTKEGEDEIERLIGEGLGDSAIARKMGLSPFAVTYRRKKLSAREAA